AVLITILFASGCGGSSAPTDTTATGNPNASKLANRVFVLNQAAGAVQIVDASTDTLSPANITIGALPEFMVLAPAVKTTLVYHSSGNLLGFLDTAQET